MGSHEEVSTVIAKYVFTCVRINRCLRERGLYGAPPEVVGDQGLRGQHPHLALRQLIAGRILKIGLKMYYTTEPTKMIRMV
jgi:hypothetical protein